MKSIASYLRNYQHFFFLPAIVLTNGNRENAPRKWKVIPLGETVQSTMVELLLLSKPTLCEHCLVNDMTYRPEAGSHQRRALYYIIDTIMHQIFESVILKSYVCCIINITYSKVC